MPLAGHDPLVDEQLHHESNPGCSEPLGSPLWEHRVRNSARHGLLGREATVEKQEKRAAHDIIRGGIAPKENEFLTTDSCGHCLVSNRRCRHKTLLPPHSFKPSYNSWYYFTMAIFSLISLLVTLRLFLLVSGAPAPVPVPAAEDAAATSYWLSSIQRQGTVAYGGANYQIFRNVKDFGATGDGSTDDTAAITAAITLGNRCGLGCDSTTVTPALVYFPPGTYIVSKPIVQLYYTQLVGDATNRPTIKGSAGFVGIALIDSDPYESGGANWYTNQNNFFRQIRNFKLDTTAMPLGAGTGIHWQVAQATSLQNIEFNMRTDGGDQNKQQGIFMDNGSGGFMTDLTFNGGHYGAFLGNQQFTTRNLVFNNCQTAIFMNWNWAWTLSGISINNCGVGIDMGDGFPQVRVGSIILADSTFANTPVGISTAYSTNQAGGTNGTLIIDNVDFSSNVPVAVQNAPNKATVLAGNTKVSLWRQGNEYTAPNAKQSVQGASTAPAKPAGLLGPDGRFFSRSKPQYETVPVSSFKSVKAAGAKGDGVTDDTQAIQNIFNSAGANDIIYFDHGAYVITNTIQVPTNIKITGEIWPLIMVGGTVFKDQANPKPAFRVGNPGDSGNVEISDLIFETLGPQPGAIMMEWNLKGASQGSAGMWDVHFRIGGTAGTQLQSNTCTKNENVIAPAKQECIGAFLLLHVTNQGGIYLENNWFWVADHELDLADHNKINIFNGRGVLIESDGAPVWMYGTSSEHSVLYNYQIANAANVYMALIQTETPYFQSNPDATTPFAVNPTYSDPTFSGSASTNKAWGLRIVDSKDVWVHGAGLYSFFENWNLDCNAINNCQENMFSIENSSGIHAYGLSTKAAKNMVTVNRQSAALDSDNRNNFCATLALFQQ